MATDMSQALFAALQAGAKVAAGGRVNHARGLLVEGHFRATATAPQFCMAAVFGGEDLRVLARFSSSGANPHIDQRSPAGEPRGLALRIGNKAAMVLVGHSLEGFPASDPEAFLAFLNAVNQRERAPAMLAAQMAGCPAVAHFEELRAGAVTSSFSALDYLMLHAYRLIATDGHARIGRLSVRATKPYVARAPPDGPDYLDKRLRGELSKGSVVFALLFTPVPEGEDPSDITRGWDPATPSFALGHIWLERLLPQQASQRRTVFDPALLPAGMGFAGDPMLHARLQAYRLAAARRLGGVRGRGAGLPAVAFPLALGASWPLRDIAGPRQWQPSEV